MNDIDTNDLQSIQGGNAGDCYTRDLGQSIDAVVLGNLFETIGGWFC